MSQRFCRRESVAMVVHAFARGARSSTMVSMEGKLMVKHQCNVSLVSYLVALGLCKTGLYALDGQNAKTLKSVKQQFVKVL
jgi:hypothetical protein